MKWLCVMVSNMLEIAFCYPVSALPAAALGFKVRRGVGTDSWRNLTHSAVALDQARTSFTKLQFHTIAAPSQMQYGVCVTEVNSLREVFGHSINSDSTNLLASDMAQKRSAPQVAVWRGFARWRVCIRSVWPVSLGSAGVWLDMSLGSLRRRDESLTVGQISNSNMLNPARSRCEIGLLFLFGSCRILYVTCCLEDSTLGLCGDDKWNIILPNSTRFVTASRSLQTCSTKQVLTAIIVKLLLWHISTSTAYHFTKTKPFIIRQHLDTTSCFLKVPFWHFPLLLLWSFSLKLT